MDKFVNRIRKKIINNIRARIITTEKDVFDLFFALPNYEKSTVEGGRHNVPKAETYAAL